MKRFLSVILLSLVGLGLFSVFTPQGKSALPNITPQEVTRPATSGGEMTLYKVGDELYFMVGYLWSDKACHLWKTSDIGDTTPSWTTVQNAPTNITFWANSYLTSDGTYLYGQTTNWTSGQSEYYGKMLNVSDGSVTDLTHDIVSLGWINNKMKRLDRERHHSLPF